MAVGLRRLVSDAEPVVRAAMRLVKAAGHRAVQRSHGRSVGEPRVPAAEHPPTARSTLGATGALSAGAIALAAGASATGLGRRGLYQDDRSVVEMLRGFDTVTLAVAVPVLSGAIHAASRGSPRAQLVWGGVLAYLVYAYAVFVFGTAFSAAFLLHVAVFGLSLVALALLLVRLDVDAISERFTLTAVTRPIAGLLGLLSASLGGMWTFYSLRFARSGARPSESKLVLPLPAVRLGYVLDLLLVVPEYAAAAGLLWRRAPWGYVLATMLLTSGTLLQLQYMTALLLQTAAKIPGATPFDPVEPFIALAMGAGAAALLAGLPRQPVLPPTSQPSAA